MLERPHVDSDKGTTLVETAIVLPILMLLILGIVELAGLYRQGFVVTYATFMAARCASVHPENPEKTMKEASRLIAFGVLPLGGMSMIDGVIKTSISTTSHGINVGLDIPKRISSPLIARTLSPLTSMTGFSRYPVRGKIDFPRLRRTPAKLPEE